MNLFEKWIELQVQKLLLWRDKIYRKLSFDLDAVEKRREKVQDYSNDVILDSPKKRNKRKDKSHQSIHAKNITNSSIIQNIGKDEVVSIDITREFDYSDNITLSLEFKYDCVVISTTKHNRTNKEVKTMVAYYENIGHYVDRAESKLHYNPFIFHSYVGNNTNHLSFRFKDTIHTSQSSLQLERDSFKILKKGSYSVASKFKADNHSMLSNTLKEVSNSKVESLSAIHSHQMPIIKKQFNGDYSNVLEDLLGQGKTNTGRLFGKAHGTVNVRERPSTYSNKVNTVNNGQYFEISIFHKLINGFYYAPKLKGWVDKDYIDLYNESKTEVNKQLFKARVISTCYLYKKDTGNIINILRPGKEIIVDSDDTTSKYGKTYSTSEGGDVDKDKIKIYGFYEEPIVDGKMDKPKSSYKPSTEDKIDRNLLVFILTENATVYKDAHPDSGAIFYLNKGDDVVGDISKKSPLPDSEEFIYLTSYEGWIRNKHLRLSGKYTSDIDTSPRHISFKPETFDNLFNLNITADFKWH